MKEFFGFGGFQRTPEGYLSWQHLLFVSILMILMVAAAILLARQNKDKDLKGKNRVLIFAAIAIDSLELFKIVLLCFRSQDPMHWLYDLPLFLCSIQLITIPLAAFSKGVVRLAALDFVYIFGILGAVLGTYFAGNNYSSYPVLSFDNVVSGLTHSISGFCSLYIALSKMTSMKTRHIGITFAILLSFCIVAYAVNVVIDYNYMFLMGGDGTPYDILYTLLNGHQIFYPLSVVALFILYISLFYCVHAVIGKKKSQTVNVFK